MARSKTRVADIPPAGFRKYPWALRKISPPEDFHYTDRAEGARAGFAARAWVRRNAHLNLAVYQRLQEDGSMTLYFRSAGARA